MTKKLEGTGKPDIVAKPLGKCPCGGDLAYSDGDDAAVLHSMPMCAEYEARDVVSFLRWVSGMRGIQ
jgi:hypothetical protein